MTLNQDWQDSEGVRCVKTAPLVNYKQNVHRTFVKHNGRNGASVSFYPILACATGLGACLSADSGMRYRPRGLLERGLWGAIAVCRR